MSKGKWFLLLIAAFPALTGAGPLSLFGPDSLVQIEQHYAGKQFLLVLWSTDCAPCRKELDRLAVFKQAAPDFRLVLLATDPQDNTGAVSRILEKHNLADADAWIFADANAQRLRYRIDPDWYGELPRAYFYDEHLNREAVSGALTAEQLRVWWYPY